MKARLLIGALALSALFWAGKRLTIAALQAYVPRGAGQILLESLYSIAWAAALYLVMRADLAEYGLLSGALPKGLTLVVLAGYAGVVAALFMWRIASLYLQPMEASARAMQVARTLGFYWLVVCVVPVFEELLFRGLLQAWAHRAFPGGVGKGPTLSWATLVTAALFSSIHLPFLWPNPTVRGWFGVGSSFVAGIILGIVRDWAGSIYPGILLHSLGNLFGF
jgi:membrane protease YdiL (CAAX protease family)